MTEPETPKQTGPAFFDPAWLRRLTRFLDTGTGKRTLTTTAIGCLLLSPFVVFSLPLAPLALVSLLAFSYLSRRRLARAVARLPLGPRTTLAVLIVVMGLVRELIIWSAEYGQGDGYVLTWHAQLIPDLLIGMGIYGAWALGWALSLRWFRYRLAEVLLIQALYGLVIEQFGQNLLDGLAAMPLGLLLWLLAMMLSAAPVGVAWILAGDKLRTLPGSGLDNSFRYAAPPLLISAAVVAIFAVWAQVLEYFQAIPKPAAPIRQRPFW
ncbi:MAG: hypothetical protein ACRDT8_03920 [Micromonosporaceae bacterium]